MICYRDMTFCTRRECGNVKCLRHLSHVPDNCELPVAVADFDGPDLPCPLRAEHDRQSAAALTGNQP